LWQGRTAAQASSEYPIGPGDIIEVNVIGVEALKDQKIRVSGDNTISLPLAGSLQVGGLTEDQLRQVVRKRLEKFMYNPQVDVFVKEYRSRQVAVLGSVRYPGFFILANPSYTILDMLAEAGGLSPDAADQLVLIPSEQSRSGPQAVPLESSAGAPSSTGQSSESLPRNAEPIVITLKNSALSGNDYYLNLPVRPGDVLVVPPAGDVMVIGWVGRPGSFKVASGLTVLAAIGAAGGTLYPAKTTNVQLIRITKTGQRLSLPIDLDAIRSGQAPDYEVRGNDVIDVPYSPWKIAPYIVYQILTRFGVGVAIPTY